MRWLPATSISSRTTKPSVEVTLISIPRDTQVTIGNHGTQKINAAYAFGGPSGAIDAVSKLAGVPITTMRKSTLMASKL